MLQLINVSNSENLNLNSTALLFLTFIKKIPEKISFFIGLPETPYDVYGPMYSASAWFVLAKPLTLSDPKG